MGKKSDYQKKFFNEPSNKLQTVSRSYLDRLPVEIPPADPLDRSQFSSTLAYKMVKEARKLYERYTDELTFLTTDGVDVSDTRWEDIYSKLIAILSENNIFNDEQQSQNVLSSLYSGLAHHLKNTSKYERSLEAFNLALHFNPNNFKALNGLGLLWEKMSNTPNAIAAYERALFIEPNYQSALINYATLLTQLFTQTNDFKFAQLSMVLLYTAEQIDPNAPIVFRNKAYLYQKLHQYDLAKDCFLRAIQLAPEEFKNYFSLADNELFFRHNFIEAESLYKKAELKARTQTDVANVYLNLSVVYMSLKDYDKAKAYANKALTYDLPNRIYGYVNLISADLGQHDYWGAYETIDKVIIQFPDNEYNPYFYWVLGNILSNFEYLEEAALAYSYSIAIEKNSFQKEMTRFYLANVVYDQGKYQAALRLYLTVRDNYNFDPQAIETGIRDAQTALQASVPLALPAVSRSKINIQDMEQQYEQIMLRRSLPKQYARIREYNLPPNAFIKDDRLFYDQDLGEVKMPYTSYFLQKHSDGKWYKLSRHPKAEKWRLANSLYLNNFVVLYDKKSHRHIVVCGRTGHYYLARETGKRIFGIPVRYAGGVLFKNGEITHWNNRSGHYKPSDEQASKEIGVVIGFPVDKFITQEKMEKIISDSLGKYARPNYRDLATYELKDLASGNKVTAYSLISEFKKR